MAGVQWLGELGGRSLDRMLGTLQAAGQTGLQLKRLELDEQAMQLQKEALEEERKYKQKQQALDDWGLGIQMAGAAAEMDSTERGKYIKALKSKEIPLPERAQQTAIGMIKSFPESSVDAMREVEEEQAQLQRQLSESQLEAQRIKNAREKLDLETTQREEAWYRQGSTGNILGQIFGSPGVPEEEASRRGLLPEEPGLPTESQMKGLVWRAVLNGESVPERLQVAVGIGEEDIQSVNALATKALRTGQPVGEMTPTRALMVAGVRMTPKQKFTAIAGLMRQGTRPLDAFAAAFGRELAFRNLTREDWAELQPILDGLQLSATDIVERFRAMENELGRGVDELLGEEDLTEEEKSVWDDLELGD